MPLPILYSFRRCPYAIRARMALTVAGMHWAHREVALRDKPAAMLKASPKGTVPVLVLPDGRVIDESLEIMRWALEQNDPAQWLAPGAAMNALIANCDGPFKYHLDRVKYPDRHAGSDPVEHRAAAGELLGPLEERLRRSAYLFGDAPSLADISLFPFVRQFARVDFQAFTEMRMPRIEAWLASLEESSLYASVMTRYPVWEAANAGV